MQSNEGVSGKALVEKVLSATKSVAQKLQAKQPLTEIDQQIILASLITLTSVVDTLVSHQGDVRVPKNWPLERP